MSKPSDNEAAGDRVADEAAAWVLRADRGLSAAEQDEFSQWLARDPRHRAEWVRHQRHWDRLAPVAQWRPEHSARPNPDLLAPPRPVRLWLAPAMVLAAAACVAVVWTMRTREPGPIAAPTATAATVVREPVARRQVLADGTVVELNRGASIAATFTAAERRVRLERGEAHFTVTKDTARPFIVTAQGMDVRAVGTAFNVRLDTAAVEVLVTEGKVQVGAAAAPVARDPLVPVLAAGQRAVLSLEAPASGAQIATLTAGEIERVLAWQHRMIDFTAASLAEVVAEFNRCNRVQLVVADNDLAEVRISASFRSDNTEGFVRLLERGFGVKAERRGADEILLRKVR